VRKAAAETVGTGQASMEEVLKGWQQSPEFKTFWTLVVGSSL
jgi:hypothetical protein